LQLRSDSDASVLVEFEKIRLPRSSCCSFSDKRGSTVILKRDEKAFFRGLRSAIYEEDQSAPKHCAFRLSIGGWPRQHRMPEVIGERGALPIACIGPVLKQPYVQARCFAKRAVGPIHERGNQLGGGVSAGIPTDVDDECRSIPKFLEECQRASFGIRTYQMHHPDVRHLFWNNPLSAHRGRIVLLWRADDFESVSIFCL